MHREDVAGRADVRTDDAGPANPESFAHGQAGQGLPAIRCRLRAMMDGHRVPGCLHQIEGDPNPFSNGIGRGFTLPARGEDEADALLATDDLPSGLPPSLVVADLDGIGLLCPDEHRVGEAVVGEAGGPPEP